MPSLTEEEARMVLWVQDALGLPDQPPARWWYLISKRGYVKAYIEPRERK